MSSRCESFSDLAPSATREIIQGRAKESTPAGARTAAVTGSRRRTVRLCQGCAEAPVTHRPRRDRVARAPRRERPDDSRAANRGRGRGCSARAPGTNRCALGIRLAEQPLLADLEPDSGSEILQTFEDGVDFVTRSACRVRALRLATTSICKRRYALCKGSDPPSFRCLPLAGGGANRLFEAGSDQRTSRRHRRFRARAAPRPSTRCGSRAAEASVSGAH